MATKTNKVRIFVERTPGDTTDEFVSVNQEQVLLPKGQYHEVSEAIAAEYYRLKEGRYRMAEHAEGIQRSNRKQEKQSRDDAFSS